MDLYSAVRRLEHPFAFEVGEDPEAPLDARGMIGDGNTVALVRVDEALSASPHAPDRAVAARMSTT